MLRFLSLYSSINDKLSSVVVSLGAIIVAFVVLALFISVVERQISGIGYTWLNDFPPLLLPWIVFPVVGVLLRHDQHVSVELFLTKLDARGRSLVRLIVYFTCTVAGITFGLATTEAVLFLKELGEVSETEVKVPIWTLYLSFPIGFILMANFAFERALIECYHLFMNDDVQA